MILARLFGPCPLWHRTPDRLTQYADQRIWYTCALCGRDVSEALADQRRSEPLDGPTITRRPLTLSEHLAQFRPKGKPFSRKVS